MKLYKLSQTVNNGYATYSSAVVCADSEDEARKMHPNNEWYWNDGKWFFKNDNSGHEIDEVYYTSWVDADNLDAIEVEYLGEADSSVKPGVVIASYLPG